MLTKIAQDGYEGGSSPFLLSSASDMAFRAGGWCYHNLMGQPIEARCGRGYLFHVVTRKGRATISFKRDSKAPSAVTISAIA